MVEIEKESSAKLSAAMLRDHVVQDDPDIHVVAGHYFWVEKNLHGAKYNIKQRD